MTSSNQEQVPELDTVVPMNETSEINWKQRCEQLQFEHQLELERIHLHYDHELKEKVSEIRIRLKREYDQHFTEFRTRLLEQQQLNNNNLNNLDQNIGEQVREQIRIAQENDQYETEQHQKLLTKQSIDNDDVKRLVNKLHTEGVHVLTLSELLSLQLNGINILKTNNSIDSLKTLHEENSYLRSLIANMNANENGNILIKSLIDIFHCEQERRLNDISQHKNVDKLEQEISNMCNYQKNALEKFFSQDRLLLINELEQTKEQLNYLKDKFQQLKQNQSQSIILNSSHLNKFYYKYLRCENYRKALIYQKRYLLILLTGYEDTEIYALNQIRCLTGDFKINDKKKLISKQKYQRYSINYRFRFRCYVTVIIGIIRMRWLVKKWTQKIATIR